MARCAAASVLGKAHRGAVDEVALHAGVEYFTVGPLLGHETVLQAGAGGSRGVSTADVRGQVLPLSAAIHRMHPPLPGTSYSSPAHRSTPPTKSPPGRSARASR